MQCKLLGLFMIAFYIFNCNEKVSISTLHYMYMGKFYVLTY